MPKGPTAAQAANIAKHKPVCGRCGGSILSPKCVPNQRTIIAMKAMEEGRWWCNHCEASHPASARRHERGDLVVCDEGAYVEAMRANKR